MSVIRLPNGVKQSNQESETISLLCVDPPCARNRVCIESVSAEPAEVRDRLVCEQRGEEEEGGGGGLSITSESARRAAPRRIIEIAKRSSIRQ